MKILILFLLIVSSSSIYSQKTIHTFVALCDNEFQGIVPVSKTLGDGKDQKNNLYWGAYYGVKNFLKRSKNWKLVETLKSNNPKVLERILFKHTTKNVYLLADAYDGEYIESTIEDFIYASNQQNPVEIIYKTDTLNFGGNADLITYTGHDGLMDFNVDINFEETSKKKRDVIILACYSKHFFAPYMKKANANPLVWTTHLMAPETYVLEAAMEGWIGNESGESIKKRAAKAYNKFQKCGEKGANRLFTTGY